MSAKRRSDYGRGRLYERAGKFYVQYWTVNEEGKRVQRSAFLTEKNDIYYALNSRALRDKRDEELFRIGKAEASNPKDMRVADFWQNVYVPFIKSETGLRNRTVTGYERIWESSLKKHFGETTMCEYSTGQGTAFITSLSAKYSRHTLQHIRALGSAIFAHAIAFDSLGKGVLTVNPWSGVKNRAGENTKGKNVPQTAHYTLAEIQNIISALGNCTVKHEVTKENLYGLRPKLHAAEKHGHADGALLMGLTFFCALRPSEAIALDWTDFDLEQWSSVHVRRSIEEDGSVVAHLKTKGSVAQLPIIEPVTSLLRLWHEQCGSPSTGWVFASSNVEKPMNIANMVNRVIKPALKEHKIAWKGLYAGRRGGATMLVDLTKGLVAAQELLRHKSMTTTANFYKKQTQNALPEGMKMLEAAAAATKA